VTSSLLIVDDHADFRGLVSSLLVADGFDVTGEVGDGESVFAEVDRLHPDVVLLDVNLPGIDGFEVAQRLAAGDDPPQVVLTSSRLASDYGQRVERAPVRGFIPKHELSGAALAALTQC
jgi:DNA-binding NarL/FixJ family response regulator